jgi:hypothetical protein
MPPNQPSPQSGEQRRLLSIATMPSAIRKSSASVPPAKYVDPELRRLQKELIQLRGSLHLWKIGSAQWLNIHRQLVDKGSEIRTLIQWSPFGLQDISRLAAVIAAPFVPLSLTIFSLEELVMRLIKLIF